MTSPTSPTTRTAQRGSGGGARGAQVAALVPRSGRDTLPGVIGWPDAVRGTEARLRAATVPPVPRATVPPVPASPATERQPSLASAFAGESSDLTVSDSVVTVSYQSVRKVAQLAGKVASAVSITLPLGVAAIIGSGLLAPDLPSWGGQCYKSTDCRPAADRELDSIKAPTQTLASEAAIALLTAGHECWNPSDGKLAASLVVQYTDPESSVPVMIPFDQKALDEGKEGRFYTLLACVPTSTTD